MITREELTAQRLKLAMKPLERYEEPVFLPVGTISDWRTGAILGAGKWKVDMDDSYDFYMEARVMWELGDWKWT
jgi:hypothetical protein